MDSLGAIYEPETVCPLALTLRQPLKPDFIPFWFKRINPISLGVLHDSYNGLLYVLHGILTLANNLNWISRGLHIVPEALHTSLLLMRILVGLPQMERVALKQFKT